MAKERYLSTYRRVYSAPRLVTVLKITGAVFVFYVAAVFIYGLSVLLYNGIYTYALKLFSMAAIPFLAVTLMRLFIDAPRPYEVFDVCELASLKKDKKSGRSFPSRHVFSAFLIGTLWLPYSILFGISTLFIGAFLAVQRVLLGIHFVKDVVAGGAIGSICGLVGVLIL